MVENYNRIVRLGSIAEKLRCVGYMICDKSSAMELMLRKLRIRLAG